MGRLYLAVTIAVAAALLTATAQTPTIEIRGIAMDADGAPLAGVEIQIRKLDRVPIIRTRSASDGSFRVPGLTPGTYRVIATMGDRAAIQEGVTFPPASSADLRLRLDRSPTCQLARVDGKGGIRGRIIDWLGEPAPAFVWLEADDRNDDRRLSSRPDGRYEIDVVPAGRYRLHVWVPGIEPNISTVEITSGQTTSVDVRMDLRRTDAAGGAAKAGERTPAASPPPLAPGFGGISGVVVDTGGGVIPGATATVRTGAGRTVQTITDRLGAYWLPNLAPGSYELRVSLAGFKTSLNRIIVVGGRWASGAVSLELGELTPHELAVKWKLKWSEALVGIRTSLGEVTLALVHNEFLACVEGGGYTRGSLEFVATSTLESPIVRLVHGREKPAAPGAAVYGLRLVSPPELVVIDAVTANVIAVEGRVVQGFDVIDRIREQLKTDGKPIEILTISRLVLL